MQFADGKDYKFSNDVGYVCSDTSQLLTTHMLLVVELKSGWVLKSLGSCFKERRSVLILRVALH